MSISIKSNADGVSGAIQVNGVDVVNIGASGITSGVPTPEVSLDGEEILTNKTIDAQLNNLLNLPETLPYSSNTILAQIHSISVSF